MKIEFYPSSKEVELLVPPPKPAANYIPEWYKKVPKFSGKKVEIKEDGPYIAGPNIKSCMPFLDSMMNGYIQETWQDISINYKEEKVIATYPAIPQIIDTRKEVNTPIDGRFYNNEFVWKAPWMPKLPKGWSMLFTHPLNNMDLPFQTVSGIIDADVFYHIPFGNFPFYIRSDFSGLIPAGTPMYQMIPIKRESWSSKSIAWNPDEQLKRRFMIGKYSFSAYKNNFHIKKDFS